MIIYLDSDFRCHLTNDGTRRAVETDAFNGRCASYIEGYRFIPAGESWTRSDGAVFTGEMVSPAEDYSRLEKAQRQYELDEAVRWESAGISNETEYRATRNYIDGEFLAVQGQLMKCIYPIPAKVSIVPGSNVRPATMEEYLESIKEA